MSGTPQKFNKNLIIAGLFTITLKCVKAVFIGIATCYEKKNVGLVLSHSITQMDGQLQFSRTLLPHNIHFLLIGKSAWWKWLFTGKINFNKLLRQLASVLFQVQYMLFLFEKKSWGAPQTASCTNTADKYANSYWKCAVWNARTGKYKKKIEKSTASGISNEPEIYFRVGRPSETIQKNSSLRKLLAWTLWREK